MFYDTEKGDHGLRYNPFKSLVIPRPIGWISTLGRDGVPNLAPFSFFNGVGYAPPTVMFSSGGHPPDFRTKDTVRNVEETGEFVVNMVSYALREKMSKTAEVVPPEVDEFAHAGLEMAPSRMVRAPRVKDSPVHLECRYMQTVHLPGHKPDKDNVVVFGRVVGIHIDDAVITEDGRIDVPKIRPVGRLGYMDYCAVDDVFTMKKLMPESGQQPGEEGSGKTRKLA